MLEIARGYFRKTLFKTYRYFKHPRRLKKSAVLRWFSLHFLDKLVWRPTQHTFAGGVAVGLFVMNQLVPGQMLWAAVLSAVFRVNIPIAIIVSWITNPFTMPIAVLLQLMFGKWVLDFFGYPTPDLPPWHQLRDSISHLQAAGDLTWQQAKDILGVQTGHDLFLVIRTVLFGGVLGGLILAPIGYLCSYFTWGFLARLARLKREARKSALPLTPPV